MADDFSNAMIPPWARAAAAGWKGILVLTAAGAAIAALATLAIKPLYPSTTLLFMAPDRLDISIEPKVRNLPEESPDMFARRKTLELLGATPQIVEKVLKAVGPRLSPEERDFETFRRTVEVVSQGELLRVRALAGTPELAAEISNLWAEAVRESVNGVVSSRESNLRFTEEGVRIAFADYGKREEAVEEFARKDDVGAKQELEIKDRQARLAALSHSIQNLDDCVRDARSLLSEAKSSRNPSSPDLGKSIAATLLRLQSLESKPTSSLQIQLQINPEYRGGAAGGGVENSVEGLEILMQHLPAKVDRLRKEFETSPLHAEIRNLRAEILRLTAKRRELEGERDVAWERYMTIVRKREEAQYVRTLGNGPLRIASAGLPESRPERPRRALYVFGAASAGLLAGLALALAKGRALAR